MNVITEWMEGWGALIEVQIKRSYTVSLYEEVTPLPKSHDGNDVIMLDGISLGRAYSVFLGASGQNLKDSAGNPRGWWLLVEGIHTEFLFVSETRIHAEIQGKFQIKVEMRGKFPRTCKHFNSPKNEIKSSPGYFHLTGTLPM